MSKSNKNKSKSIPIESDEEIDIKNEEVVKEKKKSKKPSKKKEITPVSVETTESESEHEEEETSNNLALATPSVAPKTEKEQKKKLTIAELKKIKLIKEDYDFSKIDFTSTEPRSVKNYLEFLLREFKKSNFDKDCNKFASTYNKILRSTEIDHIFELHNETIDRIKETYDYLLKTITAHTQTERCIIGISAYISRTLANNFELFKYLPDYKINLKDYENVLIHGENILLNDKIVYYDETVFRPVFETAYEKLTEFNTKNTFSDLCVFLGNKLLNLINYFSLFTAYVIIVKEISKNDDAFKIYCDKLKKNKFAEPFRNFENSDLIKKDEKTKITIIRQVYPYNKATVKKAKSSKKSKEEAPVIMTSEDVLTFNALD